MKVRVYTDYSPIRILRGVSGKQFIEPTDELAQKMGLNGYYVEVEHDSLPDERTERKLWKVVDGAVVVSEPTKEYYESKFSFKIFEGRLNQIMDVSSIIKLSQFLRTLEGMCNWPNFGGVKQLLQALVSQGIMTIVESGKITSCLAEQGIDLGQY